MKKQLLLVTTMICAVSASYGLEMTTPSVTQLPCFLGAHYRKVVTPKGDWTGVQGFVTLPEFTPDLSRRDVKTSRPLDNPSIYIGGGCGDQEIDAGLTWEVIREADGKVSAQRKAFRPFWRTDKWFSAPAKPEYYYQPGDTLYVAIRVAGREELELQVDLVNRRGTPLAPEILQPKRPADALSSLTVRMKADNFGTGKPTEFKRVNAIDQMQNEGKPAKPTQATTVGAVWHALWFERGSRTEPSSTSNSLTMACPKPGQFRVGSSDELRARGGEAIDIKGANW